MAKGDFILFWNGIFSQWYPSDFVIDGVKYNCCEQFMMAKKSLVFNDFDALEKIMLSDDPAEQKAFGRQIIGFNKKHWDTVCRKIVYDGNYAKFTQNHDLYDELMSTIGKELVEASPYDKIWGIGLAEDNPKAWDKKTWEGTNWLGEAIMKVRQELIVKNKHY